MSDDIETRLKKLEETCALQNNAISALIGVLVTSTKVELPAYNQLNEKLKALGLNTLPPRKQRSAF